jgi:hypothetical protein
MKKTISLIAVIVALLFLVVGIAFAGLNPVQQNTYTTNLQASADAAVVRVVSGMGAITNGSTNVVVVGNISGVFSGFNTNLIIVSGAGDTQLNGRYSGSGYSVSPNIETWAAGNTYIYHDSGGFHIYKTAGIAFTFPTIPYTDASGGFSINYAPNIVCGSAVVNGSMTAGSFIGTISHATSADSATTAAGGWPTTWSGASITSAVAQATHATNADIVPLSGVTGLYANQFTTNASGTQLNGGMFTNVNATSLTGVVPSANLPALNYAANTNPVIAGQVFSSAGISNYVAQHSITDQRAIDALNIYGKTLTSYGFQNNLLTAFPCYGVYNPTNSTVDMVGNTVTNLNLATVLTPLGIYLTNLNLKIGGLAPSTNQTVAITYRHRTGMYPKVSTTSTTGGRPVAGFYDASSQNGFQLAQLITLEGVNGLPGGSWNMPANVFDVNVVSNGVYSIYDKTNAFNTSASMASQVCFAGYGYSGTGFNTINGRIHETDDETITLIWGNSNGLMTTYYYNNQGKFYGGGGVVLNGNAATNYYFTPTNLVTAPLTQLVVGSLDPMNQLGTNWSYELQCVQAFNIPPTPALVEFACIGERTLDSRPKDLFVIGDSLNSENYSGYGGGYYRTNAWPYRYSQSNPDTRVWAHAEGGQYASYLFTNTIGDGTNMFFNKARWGAPNVTQHDYTVNYSHNDIIGQAQSSDTVVSNIYKLDGFVRQVPNARLWYCAGYPAGTNEIYISNPEYYTIQLKDVWSTFGKTPNQLSGGLVSWFEVVAPDDLNRTNNTQYTGDGVHPSGLNGYKVNERMASAVAARVGGGKPTQMNLTAFMPQSTNYFNQGGFNEFSYNDPNINGMVTNANLYLALPTNSIAGQLISYSSSYAVSNLYTIGGTLAPCSLPVPNYFPPGKTIQFRALNSSGYWNCIQTPAMPAVSLLLTNAQTITLTTQNTYYTVTNYNATGSFPSGFTYNLATGFVTNTYAGNYYISLGLTGSSSANNHVLECQLGLNGASDERIAAHFSPSISFPQSASASGILYLPAGTAVSVMVMDETGSGTTMSDMHSQLNLISVP